MSVLSLAAITVPTTSRVLAQSLMTVYAGDEVNLFANWDGAQPADGLNIETDEGWDVIAVEAVRLGRSERIAFSLRRSIDGVIAETSERLVGRHRLIVTLQSPSLPSTSTISITPSVRVEDSSGFHLVPQSRHEMEFSLDVKPARPSSGRALRLSESRPRPVAVNPEKLPDLRSAHGFTVAFWLKSTDREKVVLSSWSGNEFEDYPFEFYIDAQAEMRVYSGQGGMHYSVGSGTPVADGGWHHVAYSVTFANGLATLSLDGEEVNSRFLPDMSDVEITALSIGDRGSLEPEQPEQEDGRGTLNGLVDEIVFFPSSRNSQEIIHMTRVPVAILESEAGAVMIDFEPRETGTRFVRVDPDADFVDSDLSLHQPASQIVAEFHPGSVSLTWVVERPETQVLTVERSDDGVQFETVYTKTIREDESGGEGTHQHHSFEDLVFDASPIYFYRIKQEFADRTVIESQMIKIGVGALEAPTSVELIGNSPNPFATSTEVSFRVQAPTSLRLSVWSVSGHLIEVLANETRDSGSHRILFSAGDMPSGIYFLRLETDQGVQTRKMIVRR